MLRESWSLQSEWQHNMICWFAVLSLVHPCPVYLVDSLLVIGDGQRLNPSTIQCISLLKTTTQVNRDGSSLWRNFRPSRVHMTIGSLESSEEGNKSEGYPHKIVLVLAGQGHSVGAGNRTAKRYIEPTSGHRNICITRRHWPRSLR